MILANSRNNNENVYENDERRKSGGDKRTNLITIRAHPTSQNTHDVKTYD
jgi:hypothetical protein